MAKHRKMMEAETNTNKRTKWAQKMERWNKALIEVAGLKGKDVNDRLETEFIEEIVNDIYRRLHAPLKIPLPLLIGMDYSIKFVTSWLKDTSSHTAEILTILGMGGIGKTSLAKYVYGLHCRRFKRSSYIGNISSRCSEKFSGLLELQKQLYDDITKSSSVQVHDVSIYTSKIENLVELKNVFLVLDEVDSLDQLDALLGSKGLFTGSKVIITTKDAWLTESCALFKMNVKPKHAKHLLQGLHENASRKLFCFHAFMSNDPKAGYEEVLEKLVKYCEGHPLALEVLGKSLYNRDVAYWEDRVKWLMKETSSPVDNVLRMSFDFLPSENDKDLFKHIACFFGVDREVVETILMACGISTRSGITNLIDRCLLSIGWNNEIMMHQLVQKMGRLIVHQESPDKPWKRSRLWCHEDSLKVLKRKKGKGNLLGLFLDIRMLEKEKLQASFELKTNALSNMDNLMLLQLNYVKINGSYKNFPEELRSLCMHGFPLKSIPSDLPVENLVALDMSYSNIISFGLCYSNPERLQKRQKLTGPCLKDKRLFGLLKILNFSFCEQLCSLGGFEELPALERLILRHCIGLLEICESIEKSVELVHIDLGYCYNLEKLPRGLRMLKKVKTLLLDGCNLGEFRIKNRDTESSKTSFSSGVLDIIPHDSKFFVISLPTSLVRLSLVNNNLFTESFPMDFSSLPVLKDLYLDENPIVSMPNCVRTLRRLEILSMRNCKSLTTVEHPPHTITYLDVFSNQQPFLLQKVVFDPEVSPLKFAIEWMMLRPSSFEFEGVIKVQPMAGVEKKVLRSLGWTEMDFLNERRVATEVLSRGREETEIQMYYEFGIFSTLYGGNEMPNWITERSKGPSISFTIPSSSNKLMGLNFCNVFTSQFLGDEDLDLPMIIISNTTKNRTWIYHHYVYRVDVGGDSAILLSHWMFGMNEMEAGDNVTITLTQNLGLTKECGVSFVYDGRNTNEEEDALGYYKSWNHIIGGDLTGFQTTTEEYILNSMRFLLPAGIEVLPNYRPFIGDASYKEEELRFRALSPRKS